MQLSTILSILAAANVALGWELTVRGEHGKAVTANDMSQAGECICVEPIVAETVLFQDRINSRSSVAFFTDENCKHQVYERCESPFTDTLRPGKLIRAYQVE